MCDFLNLKTEAFGLDISDLSLKIVKLKKKGKFFELASYGETAIKPGIIEKGEIKNEKALSEIIKEGLGKVKGEKLKTKYVVASLPEEKVFLEVIQLPMMKEEEAEKAVYFEAENYIPLPIEQVYLDSQMVHPVYNHLDHTDVLIAASPKKIIDSYIFSLKGAGLRSLVLEIESQAISRALVKNGATQEPLLLIDSGANRTSFIIFSGYSLRFTSSLSFSGRKLTEIISQDWKVDLKEAERLKIKHGIKNSAEGRKNLKVLRPILIDLVEELKKCLDYYHSHSSHEHLLPNGKKIGNILLCGGGANLKGLGDFLSSELRCPAGLGNPWVNVLPQTLKKAPKLSEQESLKYTTAIGLALRGMLK